jgi:radical SAM/Cys-rich protein
VAPGKTLLGRGDPLAAGGEQVRRLEALPGPRFAERLAAAGLPPLRATGLEVFQVNVGKLCNQTCRHCHVDAGPIAPEQPPRLPSLPRRAGPYGRAGLDITAARPSWRPASAGSPRRLARPPRDDRCNPTVLLPARPTCLAPRRAPRRDRRVAAVVPRSSTDAQERRGHLRLLVVALRRLNELGYGRPGSGLSLTLVHNPVGALLPPPQAETEARFKAELARRHGIVFDRLFCITNMPISRYLEWLRDTGNLEGYVERLVAAFNPLAAEQVMCRTTISVGYDGTLRLRLQPDARLPVLPARRATCDFDPCCVATRRIATARHCWPWPGAAPAGLDHQRNPGAAGAELGRRRRSTPTCAVLRRSPRRESLSFCAASTASPRSLARSMEMAMRKVGLVRRRSSWAAGRDPVPAAPVGDRYDLVGV